MQIFLSMVIKLDASHKDAVLDFCYQHEHENLFVIGSFKNYPEPFLTNRFYGAFENGRLMGLGVLFSRFGNLVINVPNDEIIADLVDFAVADYADIRCVAGFEKYAKSTIGHLEHAYGKNPKTISQQTVFMLTETDFRNHADSTERMATEADTDAIVTFVTGKEPSTITDADRAKIFPEQEFLLWRHGQIVSRANIHGLSANYFQVGGVITAPEHRSKGYARQVVSFLCSHYFSIGKKCGLLFTANDNLPAQKVYRSIGFEPDEGFLVAEY